MALFLSPIAKDVRKELIRRTQEEHAQKRKIIPDSRKTVILFDLLSMILVVVF